MRVVSSQVLDLLETGTFVRRDMILFDMPSGMYGFWNNNYDYTYSGNLYRAIPGVFQVADVPSTSQLVVNRIDINFNRLDPSVGQYIENEAYHRRPVVGYVALINPSTGVIVDVVNWFTAVIDQVEVEEAVGSTSTLIVRLDVGNWELAKSGSRTRSNADQLEIDSTDKGFEYVSAAVTQPIWWGRAGPTRPSNAVGPGSTGTTSGSPFSRR